MQKHNKLLITTMFVFVIVATLVNASHTIYDPGSNKCLYQPPTGVSCTSGFVYNSGKNVCEGTAKPVCLQNGVYDERLKSCTTIANVAEACPGGQVVIESGRPKCQSSPSNVCAVGYVFELGKCVQSTVKPKSQITKFLSDPLFLISVALIVASIYLYGKKGRR